MPLCSLFLIQLSPSTSVQSFLFNLRCSLPEDIQPLVTAKVIRWMIPPWHESSSVPTAESVTHLTDATWDVLVILSNADSFPSDLSSKIQRTYSLKVGIPSRITSTLLSTVNPKLLHPDPSSIPQSTGSLKSPLVATTTKNLELTPELFEWIKSVSPSPTNVTDPRTTPQIREPKPRLQGAVSMLNLLSFKPPPAKETYALYGKSFSTSIGIRRGGIAKIVGNVISTTSSPSLPSSTHNDAPWDEIALAHYPTLQHFADMVASKDYQDANRRYRVPSLAGTGILCCDELDKKVLGAARDWRRWLRGQPKL